MTAIIIIEFMIAFASIFVLAKFKFEELKEKRIKDQIELNHWYNYMSDEIIKIRYNNYTYRGIYFPEAKENEIALRNKCTPKEFYEFLLEREKENPHPKSYELPDEFKHLKP